MNQKEYAKAIDEMEIPASKILTWANLLREGYYNEFNELHQGYLDRILESSQKLIDLIPKLKLLTSELDKLEAITHGLGGPIIVMRDYTKLMIAQLNTQQETDNEAERYLKKINNAAEYLYSLDRDIVLKMMRNES